MPFPVTKQNISKFDNVGSLVHSLFNREMGFPCSVDPSGWLDLQITRQLIYSRAPGDGRPTQPESEPLDTNITKNPQQSSGQNIIVQKTEKSNSNWSKAKLTESILPRNRDRNMTKTRRVDFLDDYLMITEPLSNQVKIRNVFMPNTSGVGKNFVWKYGLLDDSKLKWLSFDVWYVTCVSTEVDRNGQIVVPRRLATLFALQSRRLLLYNFETGAKMDELCLSSSSTSQINYITVDVYPEEDRVYIAASRSSLPPALQHEFIILSYPPLNILYRVQIPKGVFGKGVKDVETVGSFFYIARSSLVETCSLEDLIRMNENSIINEGSDLDGKTIKVENCPPVLFSFRSKNCYSSIIPHIWPPHIIGKVKDGFEIFNMQHPEHPIDKILKDDESEIFGREPILHCYNSDAPQIILQNLPHGFDILDVKLSQSSSVVQRAFTTKVLNDIADTRRLMEQNEATAGRVARGLRNIARKNYLDADKSKDYGFGYCGDLDLFAVAIASSQDGTLEVSLYDNFTKKLFKKLQPVCLRPRNKSSVPSSLSLSVHFQWSNIKIKVKAFTHQFTCHSDELFTLNLMAEGISL